MDVFSDLVLQTFWLVVCYITSYYFGYVNYPYSYETIILSYTREPRKSFRNIGYCAGVIIVLPSRSGVKLPQNMYIVCVLVDILSILQFIVYIYIYIYIFGHDRETLSKCIYLLVLCDGNHRSPVDSPHKGPITRIFDIFFVVSLKRLLIKQPSCLWFETSWCACDRTVMVRLRLLLWNKDSPPDMSRDVIDLMIYCVRT